MLGAVTTTVYTDGACIGNPGPGGWAWAVPEGAYASGAEPRSTNQRMEVTAALEALRALDGPVVVVSDSQYVVRCFNDRWYQGWERRGWKGSNRQSIANQDLWEPMVELFHIRGHELTFRWVKGHSTDVMNDVVDRLANEAARAQRPRHGSQPPTVLGEPDRPEGAFGGAPRGQGRATRGDGAPEAGRLGSGAAPEAPEVSAAPEAPAGRAAPDGGAARGGRVAPDGHRVVVLGHRPPALGGYEDNPVAAGVRRRLAEMLGGLQALHPDLVVLTGLGLGAEQLGARAALDVGVPYIAVLAYPAPDSVWPAASRAAYQELIKGAREVIVLPAEEPMSKERAGMAVRRRNSWLVSLADGALVVWDSTDRALAADVHALERRIPDDVIIIPPSSA